MKRRLLLLVWAGILVTGASQAPAVPPDYWNPPPPG